MSLMGSVVPLKKSANSAYLELKNLLGDKLQKVECSNSFPYIIDERIWTTTVA